MELYRTEQADKVQRWKEEEKSHLLITESRHNFRLWAIIASWISTVISLGLGVLAIVSSVMLDSQSLLGFGLDSIMDSLSSMVVLWRFYGDDNDMASIREIKACLFIGALFILSACLLAGTSIYALVVVETVDKPLVTFILSAINAFCCLVLGIAKVLLGIKLRCRSLFTDSITTLTGAVISIFTLIFAVVYSHNASLWYLDSAFAILCGIFLACYGAGVIYISMKELRLETAFLDNKAYPGR